MTGATLEPASRNVRSTHETLLERLFPVYIRRMNDFTAVIKHDNEWWYGWIEEVPGVNAQERSREELIVALRECLSEAIEMNRRDALESAEHDYSEEPIAL